MARATRASAAQATEQIKNMESSPQQLSSPPATPKTAKNRAKKLKASPKVKAEPPSTPANTGRKRGRAAVKQEDGDVNDLPHNLGTVMPTPGGDGDAAAAEPPKKRTRRAKKSASPDAVKTEALAEGAIEETSKKTPKKSKGYGLTPGVSPFPEYERPTPEECKEGT